MEEWEYEYDTLARVMTYGIYVFGCEERFKEWLEPHKDLLVDVPSMQELEAMLMQIHKGD